METVRIDIDQLAQYIQWKMNEEDMSLREVAAAAGVSAATLSRILRKGGKRPQPDVDTLGKLVRWAEVPIEKIVEPSARSSGSARSNRETLEVIQAHLRADRNLSAEAAQAIANVVKVAYAQFAKGRRGRR
ncbi:MAG: helix-turn-helix domain-containing protein [Acidobacteria bacterium]|nr:helix-turn-helix domain-containing protein [Acidobacteriota bacterium]